ncbi:hypothetical protein D3C76_540320 [compost metagenome]|uniref:YqjK-like protein n=1 Tax=Pseudomonas jinjuensis TaxID=198616 RepID=A0A1H0AGN0_9PSED|nr:hypothetical protein [Pseudomonas jinjuensis]SDN32710.1 hypothetical protein SAMN05216193_102229 [Pseudomonas jinjuensis]
MNESRSMPRQTRREMQKTIVRLRLELQRQQLVHETQQLLRPLAQVRNLGQSVRQQLSGHTPLLAGTGGALLLALLTGKHRRLGQLLKLGLVLAPLLLNLRQAKKAEDHAPPPTTHL